MIVFIIVVILVVCGLKELAKASDWRASDYNAEMRHLELMDCIDSNRELTAYNSYPSYLEDRDIDRRMERDEYGNEVWEEHVHEHREEY